MSSAMLDSYRHILRPPTAAFSMTGLVARLPISMVGLGIVLLAEHATGSYGFAGSVSAVALIANALLAIPQGRLIDRLGQGRVLSVVITIWGASLALAMWSLEQDWPRLTTYVFAAVAGGSLPSVGVCVRARWSHVLAEDPRGLHTAFSLEAVIDEVVFLVGPILVTMLATAVHPVAGLTTALIAGVGGTWVFSALRSTEPPVHMQDRSSAASRDPMPWSSVAPLTLLFVALGVLFGAAEVATVAFAEEQGDQRTAGFLLAVWALGSLLAGVAFGAIHWRANNLTRLRWGALALAIAMVPLPWVPSIPVMFAVLVAGGTAISPTLIAANSLAEQVLPAARLTEGLAFMQTGLAAGLAPGAAVAGVVIDARGASPAYVVCMVGGLVVLLASLVTRGATVTAANVPAHERSLG